MTLELIGMGQVREMLDGLPITSDWLEKHARIKPVGVFGNNSSLYDKSRIERFVKMFRQGVADAAFVAQNPRIQYRSFSPAELMDRVYLVDSFKSPIEQAVRHISEVVQKTPTYDADLGYVRGELANLVDYVVFRFRDEGSV